LGYDVRARKLLVFAIAAGIAGLAGVLFANWGSFISPNVFSIGFTAQIIMWIMIGGLGTLIGPVIGSVSFKVWSLGWVRRKSLIRTWCSAFSSFCL
jgi:ABC-type branched-subunit amino acid transport system permease subunit